MFSNRGGSNRARAYRYRDLLESHGLRVLAFEVLETLDDAQLASAKPRFAPVFRALSNEELRILKFRIVARKKNRG